MLPFHLKLLVGILEKGTFTLLLLDSPYTHRASKIFPEIPNLAEKLFLGTNFMLFSECALNFGISFG